MLLIWVQTTTCIRLLNVIIFIIHFNRIPLNRWWLDVSQFSTIMLFIAYIAIIFFWNKTIIFILMRKIKQQTCIYYERVCKYSSKFVRTMCTRKKTNKHFNFLIVLQ